MTDEQVKQTFLNLVGEKVRARIKLFNLFRRNAAMKHGVPLDELSDEIVVKHVVQQTTPQGTEAPKPTPLESSVKSQVPDWLKIVALGIPALLAAAVGGYLLNNNNQQPQPQPQQQEQVAQPTDVKPSSHTIIREKDKPESALQWIEDRGDHLP